MRTHRRNLLCEYQPHDLHQFRVHIRRVRALMKFVPALRNKPLRRDWRNLFAATNHARDWDVLLPAVREWLSAPQAEAFESAMQQRVERHHVQALTMLGSRAWRAHMVAWAEFLDSVAGAPWALPGDLLPNIDDRVSAALERALGQDDRESWHRYRIEIKNQRYVATILLDAGLGEPGLSGLVERCRIMQDLLGDWHDCSVQLKAIQSEEVQRDLAQVAGGADISQRLVDDIGAKRMRLMRAMRATAQPEEEPQSGEAESE